MISQCSSQAQELGHEPALCHHADWLATMLHGQPSVTDWNSCLKAGWDPSLQAYPPWLLEQVMPAGIKACLVQYTGFHRIVVVAAAGPLLVLLLVLGTAWA